MHLIHIQPIDNSSRLIIELEYHISDVPPYAILSHRWGAPQDEVTFQDIVCRDGAARQKKGYVKLESFCAIVLEYGLSYAWVDTCCIDKSSSAELSEAINSMYAWYMDSRVCFAYLEDVTARSDIHAAESEFRKSAWFTRGWTLQELIAPLEVIFIPSEWDAPTLGTRESLAGLIEEITNVQKSVLLDRRTLRNASVAQKMSWASNRHTTRLEDEAYSLIGLFGVNMATIYGEGRRAFRRLQEEIIRNTSDHSIFAWDGIGECLGMLASSPRQFADSAGYTPIEYSEFFERFRIQDDTSLVLNYSLSNLGLQIQLPVVELAECFKGITMAFLACAFGHDKQSTVIFLKARRGRPKGHYNRVPFDGRTVIHRPTPKQYRCHASPELMWISDDEEPFRDALSPTLGKSPDIAYEMSVNASFESVTRYYQPVIEIQNHHLNDCQVPPADRPKISVIPTQSGVPYFKSTFQLEHLQIGDLILIRVKSVGTSELATVMLALHDFQHWTRVWLPAGNMWDADKMPTVNCHDPLRYEDLDLFNYTPLWFDTDRRQAQDGISITVDSPRMTDLVSWGIQSHYSTRENYSGSGIHITITRATLVQGLSKVHIKYYIVID